MTQKLPLPQLNGDVLEYDQSQTNEINRLIDVFYPVGTLYESVNAANPSTFMGGTWVVHGTGQVTVAIDPAQTEFDAVGKTGGSKTHELTLAQMPSHSHPANTVIGWGTLAGSGILGTIGNTAQYRTAVSVEAVGGGQAHNNLQPFIVVYRFRRIA